MSAAAVATAYINDLKSLRVTHEPLSKANVSNKDHFVCESSPDSVVPASAGNTSGVLDCLRSVVRNIHTCTEDSSELRKLHRRELHLAPLGAGQFLVRVTINGEKLCVLYDSGASLCFARTGLPLLSDPNCASESKDGGLLSGGLQIRLGDDSLAKTGGCMFLKYTRSIGKHKHDWDYHVMDFA